MDSPPSCSVTLSEILVLSEDSGLLLTSDHSGSLDVVSSCSDQSSHCYYTMECPESEDEEETDKSGLIHDNLCNENCNTVKRYPKKVPEMEKQLIPTIDPPLEFQDKPPSSSHDLSVELIQEVAEEITDSIISECMRLFISEHLKPDEDPPSLNKMDAKTSQKRMFWTSELIYSTSSRSSLSSSRLSSSHNSLSVTAANKVDDSSFITSAMSHDILSITDMYNVPLDSDIYAIPADSVRGKDKKKVPHKLYRYNTSKKKDPLSSIESNVSSSFCNYNPNRKQKRNSTPSRSMSTLASGEPIQMTLQQVRQFLHNLYSSSSSETLSKTKQAVYKSYNLNVNDGRGQIMKTNGSRRIVKCKKSKNLSKKTKDSCDNKNLSFNSNVNNNNVNSTSNNNNLDGFSDLQKNGVDGVKKLTQPPPSRSSFKSSLKQTLCNLFRLRKYSSPAESETQPTDTVLVVDVSKPPFQKRALPPVPGVSITFPQPDIEKFNQQDSIMDFATNIEKVKDYGWYWGPISGEAAEKILSNEPDGSFIVRDSSDDHYIFSLTFKLNGCVRHVRIEHDQGNFSFGSCTKFKSHTIVDFIENAVEHSRSGRYLFFLHRRPILGPMRVQLLHPVSRFKQVQSLQHMCRFVILKHVRKDLIPQLPLPRRMIDYLNVPHYYSEEFFEEEQTEISSPLHFFSFVAPQ
nr:PREDICTED: MATH and LRR domain-containing protein PFE0570w-like [Bemisia tabaci]XP_018898010.1 PREDICTED: MATH and LRR domain-containing protein PFE0570w-like [Bemisia tabaci]